MSRTHRRLLDLLIGHDTHQRLTGLVQEIFLEKKIIPRLQSGTVFATGWLSVKAQAGRDSWYQVKTATAQLTSFEWELHEHISKNLGDDSYVVEVVSVSDDLQLDLHCYCYSTGTLKFDRAWSDRLINRAKQNRENLFFLLGKDAKSEEKNEIRPFFEGLGFQEIEKIFFERCVKNLCFSNAIDLDAILKSKEIYQILEYKRKTPMKRPFPFLRKGILNVAEVRKLEEKFQIICKYYHFVGYQEGRDIIKDLIRSDYENWIRPENPICWAYGLDLSHAEKMADITTRWKGGYIYLIWNCERGNGIGDCLTTNLEPKKGWFEVASIKQEDIIGITFTPNEDSGSYETEDSSVRVQVCFTRSIFKPRNSLRY